MPIQFEHVQKAVDANQTMGNASTTLTFPPGPYTDKEVWRWWINPGYTGTFDFIEAVFRFRAYATGPTNSAAVTWKWQLRPKGQTGWTDIHSQVSDTFTTNTERTLSVIFDAVSPAAEAVPFELRLVFSTADTDDSIVFITTNTTASSTILRIVGETQ